ncbi:MAG: DNA repair protein rad2 [Bathelium mastoideum]|nr:MAG: DNA repair protein rad2 [Bathelium mastoideum]
MGVTGLWTVVQPCARPIKIETLNRKRLAVDASIWIYQFLKAVRDKEGNALRNSHVVGFFRRICKLLFFGIKPVFVFDGGAPALKRQTISGRKQRREGRREDAVRTAGKLLALQMQRRAEEDEQKRKREAEQPTRQDEEEPLPENMVYVDEIQMTPKERQQARKFKKRDAYHLPDLDASLAEMGGPNDPRVMSLEELQEYAQQFQQGEDINVYDFSKIDFDSPFFTSLPASDRYNILNAARLRSRLRMGYSKDQLDVMFPDRMAFSRFQVERVRERNELTQRLMNINGMVDDAAWGGGRVAGEKGKEYILVRNDGVEGGWALGVVSDKDQGKEDKPIEVDELDRPALEDKDMQSSDDDEFEDIPVEGLNRLPRRVAPRVNDGIADSVSQHRQEVSESRKDVADSQRNASKDDPNSLFVPESSMNPNVTEENIFGNDQAIPTGDEDEQAQLDKAIAMSLEGNDDFDEQDDFSEVFQQKKADEPRPFTKGSGQALAMVANKRSRMAAPKSSIAMDSESEDEDISLQIALAESKKAERQIAKPVHPATKKTSESVAQAPESQKPLVPSGPLPFEALDLGSSLLGRKKMKKLTEESEGGFDKIGEAEKEKAPKSLPPWFSGNLEDDGKAQKAFDEAQRHPDETDVEPIFQKEELRGTRAANAVDVDAAESPGKGVVNIESDEEEPTLDIPQEVSIENAVVEDTELRMGDLADMTRVEPPRPQSPVEASRKVTGNVSESNDEQAPRLLDQTQPGGASHVEAAKDDGDLLEWSDSDHEQPSFTKDSPSMQDTDPAGGVAQLEKSRSPSVEFEDVGISADPSSTSALSIPQERQSEVQVDAEEGPPPASGTANQIVDGDGEQDGDLYSDPEDEDLLRQLAAEAEEHARFASSLNNSTNHLSVDEYERELRQLRNQQKKDRRDADEVTQVMITECQQLLRLFGLPYITAPMEAEAQCAEMVSLGLVDGIVTDDSDIFLFGGTRIYKNMFNQAKFVECYLSSDLEKEFDLNREKLIGIAHLLGSDYTEGLPGVGPVTALEIISEFPSLSDFKEWWTGVQSAQIPKSADAGSAFRKKFRRQATKLFLPPTFPDTRVEEAYLKPDIDADPQPFEWGVPDLNALRSFLMATIGWSEARTDEVLVPVIKDMNKRQDEGTQANITKFFQGGTGVGAFAPRVKGQVKSKRMDDALGKMAEEARKKRRASGREPDGEVGNASDSDGIGGDPADGADDADGASDHGGSKKRSRRTDDEESEEYDAPQQPPRRRVRSSKRGKI